MTENTVTAATWRELATDRPASFYEKRYAEGLSVLSPGWPALPVGSDAKTSDEFNRLCEL